MVEVEKNLHKEVVVTGYTVIPKKAVNVSFIILYELIENITKGENFWDLDALLF